MTKYLSIKTIEISGFAAALEALRLPFGKECRSYYKGFCTSDSNTIHYRTDCNIDEKDLKLMSTLIKRGDEHSKAVRGIMVFALIDAPRYWWQEMVTYEVGVTKLTSNSTMHQECKGMSTEELVAAKEAMPEGTRQKRVYAISYQTLRRIYHQRHDHRLPHWQIFCEWMKTLPFANELIFVGIKDDEG